MSLLPTIDATTADTLVEFYKNPTGVELPPTLTELAKIVSQIKMLFADKWKRRDIVEHLKNEWGLDERTAYNRINIAVRCFPDITKPYIDFEIQLLLDYQLDALQASMGVNDKLFLGMMKERRLLLMYLNNSLEGDGEKRGSTVVTNYIVIQNNGGQPTKVSEHEMANMDIAGRNAILKKAQQKMLPENFIELLPADEKAKYDV